MVNIIQWPESQICMDCEHSSWLSVADDKYIYPASICDINHSPESSECSKLKDKWENVTVDLIAAGYEWTCPNCEESNSEIEVVEKVQCKGCQLEFKVVTYDHALEN